MPQPTSLRLAARPSSGAKARRFVREHLSLDSMRHTEADLLVTELVANAIRHGAAADDLVVEVVDPSDASGARVAVSHPHPHPLIDPSPGVGFTLLDRIALAWGHDHENGRLTVWFRLRRPGSAAVQADMDDSSLLERLEEDPAAYSDELVRRHRDLAVSIASRYRGRGISAEDVEQVAMMALLKAIRRFDPDLGDLRSYAAATISGEMKKLLRDMAWAIRVPRSIQERALEVARAAAELSQVLERTAEVEEIADQLDLTPDEVTEALAARHAYSTRSLEQPPDASGMPVADRLEDPGMGAAATEDRLALSEAIDGLPLRQRRILDLRFNHDMTQAEIGEELGISQMHVSRLLAEAIEALRSYMEVDPS